MIDRLLDRRALALGIAFSFAAAGPALATGEAETGAFGDLGNAPVVVRVIGPEVVPAANPAANPAVDPAVDPAAAPKSTPPAVSSAIPQATPRWLTPEGQPSPHAKALLDALSQAHTHALPASRYGAEALARRLATPTADPGLARALDQAFLAYARDLTSGLLEPRDIDPNIMVEPPRPDAAALLSGLAEARDPVAFLATLAPRHPEYAALKARLAEFRALATQGQAWGTPIPGGATLRPGARSERVAALRARLGAMGDLAPGTASSGASDYRLGASDIPVVVAANDIVVDVAPRSTTDPRSYSPELVAAVKRFQARHGLNEDGVVGPATLEALNHSAAFRARKIAVNLERLRWLNKPLGRRHVMVNLAGYRMALVENDREIFTSRVVVGKPKHATPEFSDEMEHMVINPTWYVPTSIAVNEILPKLRRDPGYLARKNMRLSGGRSPWSVDWNNVGRSNFPGSISQAPGPGNALGRVKFMFPNDHAIYLHDTPAKKLFGRDMRAHSHGCVRVQEPYAFAHALLAAQTADPEGSFSRWLKRGRERYVNLETHVPVHLTYRTAWIDGDGRDQFRSDIYGRDALVAKALSQARVALPEG
ncbi:MAG: L,D-transpeptidase family protein [Pseudomonadota bacterium]